MTFSTDAELLAAIRTDLYTAVIADVLDQMRQPPQILPHIRPLRDDMVVVGHAMPVLIRDEVGNDQDRWGQLLESLDALQPDEVYITGGGNTPYAIWGELMSTRAIHLRAAGAVIDGYCRDTAAILKLSFPTFCVGTCALDINYRGKVVDYGVPVDVAGVRVEPGDVVFGDRDGVLIVPKRLAHEAFERALEKVHSENRVRDAFREGVSAVEAFARFGVL